MLSPQRYDCDLCERSFPTLSSVKQHYSSTHRKGQGGFSCHICDRKYTQISNLCRHMRHDHTVFSSTTQRHQQVNRGSSRSSFRSNAQQNMDYCNGIETKTWLGDSGLPSFVKNSSIETAAFSWPTKMKLDRPSVESSIDGSIAGSSSSTFPSPLSMLSSPSNPLAPLFPFPWMLSPYVPPMNPIVMANFHLRLMYDTMVKSMASSYSDVVGATSRDEGSLDGSDCTGRNCSATPQVQTVTLPTTSFINKMADSERHTRCRSSIDRRLDSGFDDVSLETRIRDVRTDDDGALDLRLVHSPDNLVLRDVITPAWFTSPTTVGRDSGDMDGSTLERSPSPRDVTFPVTQGDRDSPTTSGLPVFSAIQAQSLPRHFGSRMGRLQTSMLRDDGLSSRSVCQFCHAELAGPANLKRHMRIHTGERPYECIHCGRLFSISSNLKRHVISVHKMANSYRRDHCDVVSPCSHVS